MAISKVERLLNLMNVLLDAPRAVPASQIRAQVPGYADNEGAFHRTFERDKDDLREMGVPLLVEEVPGVDPPITGYRIRKEDYYLRDPGLEPDELDAINLAAATVGLEGGPGREALWKLGGSSSGATAERVASLPADPDLVAAFQGVIERRVLRFRYRDVERDVNPYRLEFVRGRWYLNGFDHTRDEERWYRLSRVDGGIAVGDTPKAFTRPEGSIPGLQLDPWALGPEAEEVEARLWADPIAAPEILRDLDEDDDDDAEVVERRGDGSVVVAYRVTNPDGFRSYVLGYLEHVEVLSPPSLRADLVAWLGALAGDAS